MVEEQFHYTCDQEGCKAKMVLQAPSIPEDWFAFVLFDGQTMEYRGHLCSEHKARFVASLGSNVVCKKHGSTR
jgi:hypothetical protein